MSAAEDGASASNRWRTQAFRDQIVLYLKNHGFHQAQGNDRPETEKLSEAIRGRSDILGLSWALSVRRRQTIDLSGSLVQAGLRALSAGQPLYAAIHHRRGGTIKDAYVTMPLEVFLHVLRLTEADEGPEALAQ